MAYTVTNGAQGARGLAGIVLIDPGQTVTIELTDDQALALDAFEGVEVKEEVSEAPKRGRPPATASAE